MGLRALARIVMVVGGQEYPPRLERLERLYGRLAAGMATGATLGGCRFMPAKGPHRGRILVVREPVALADVPVRPGERLHWDHRFAVRLSRSTRARRGGLRLGPLGSDGWAHVRAAVPAPTAGIPAPARPGLPALRDGLGLLSVPHLGFEYSRNHRLTMIIDSFSPRISLAGGTFTVA
ncbi:MAG TPA: hypothetical protein VIK47_04015 [Kiloniellales bacterium]